MFNTKTRLPFTDRLGTCSVGVLAKVLYPASTYDTALPLDWVKDCTDKGFDPRGSAVWMYNNDVMGNPAALTYEFYYWYIKTYNVPPLCPASAYPNA